MLPDPLRRLRAVPWLAAEPLSGELVAALERVLSGAAADKELDALLRAHRDLPPEARAAAAESIFGVGLWRRRLAWHTSGDRSARLLWFALVRSLGKLVWEDAARLCGFPHDFALRSGTPEELGDRWSAPDWLVLLLERELGSDGADRFLGAVSVPGPVFLRVNTLRTNAQELAKKLAAEGVVTEPATHARHGLRVLSDRPNFYGLAAKQQALFEIQDEGSQLLAQLLEASPGQSALDYCAGAGGKTLALCCDVGASGIVHAYDLDSGRLSRLRTRAEQAGAPNVRIHFNPPDPSFLVDRVLVDAPCSELGAIRRGPDVRWRLDPSTFSRLPKLQLELLGRASTHVRPGGRLVYATCTLRREENEEVARAFERAHPDFSRTLPAWAKEFDHQGYFRALPHLHGTDGFFAAVYERESR